jgi:hypothetical protein
MNPAEFNCHVPRKRLKHDVIPTLFCLDEIVEEEVIQDIADGAVSWHLQETHGIVAAESVDVAVVPEIVETGKSDDTEPTDVSTGSETVTDVLMLCNWQSEMVIAEAIAADDTELMQLQAAVEQIAPEAANDETARDQPQEVTFELLTGTHRLICH